MSSVIYSTELYNLFFSWPFDYFPKRLSNFSPSRNTPCTLTTIRNREKGCHATLLDIPSLGFDERSARETLWSEKWLTTYRHKVHEYLDSLYIFRFSWTAQNTWPNQMIIHTWFRGLGQVSDVLKPLCVGVHGIRIKLALQRKHKRSKENTFIKKKSLWFLLYCLLLISFVQNIWTIYTRKNKTCLT